MNDKTAGLRSWLSEQLISRPARRAGSEAAKAALPVLEKRYRELLRELEKKEHVWRAAMAMGGATAIGSGAGVAGGLLIGRAFQEKKALVRKTPSGDIARQAADRERRIVRPTPSTAFVPAEKHATDLLDEVVHRKIADDGAPPPQPALGGLAGSVPPPGPPKRSPSIEELEDAERSMRRARGESRVATPNAHTWPEHRGTETLRAMRATLSPSELARNAALAAGRAAEARRMAQEQIPEEMVGGVYHRVPGGWFSKGRVETLVPPTPSRRFEPRPAAKPIEKGGAKAVESPYAPLVDDRSEQLRAMRLAALLRGRMEEQRARSSLGFMPQAREFGREVGRRGVEIGKAFTTSPSAVLGEVGRGYREIAKALPALPAERPYYSPGYGLGGGSLLEQAADVARDVRARAGHWAGEAKASPGGMNKRALLGDVATGAYETAATIPSRIGGALALGLPAAAIGGALGAHARLRDPGGLIGGTKGLRELMPIIRKDPRLGLLTAAGLAIPGAVLAGVPAAVIGAIMGGRGAARRRTIEEAVRRVQEEKSAMDKTALVEGKDIPKKVKEIADAVRRDNPEMPDATAYRVAWDQYHKRIGGEVTGGPKTGYGKEAAVDLLERVKLANGGMKGARPTPGPERALGIIRRPWVGRAGQPLGEGPLMEPERKTLSMIQRKRRTSFEPASERVAPPRVAGRIGIVPAKPLAAPAAPEARAASPVAMPVLAPGPKTLGPVEKKGAEWRELVQRKKRDLGMPQAGKAEKPAVLQEAMQKADREYTSKTEAKKTAQEAAAEVSVDKNVLQGALFGAAKGLGAEKNWEARCLCRALLDKWMAQGHSANQAYAVIGKAVVGNGKNMPVGSHEGEDLEALSKMGAAQTLLKEARELTGRGRERLSKGEFAIPEREAYPIHDLPHARNALARVSAHGTSEEQSRVRKAVYSRYPELKERKEERGEKVSSLLDEVVESRLTDLGV